MHRVPLNILPRVDCDDHFEEDCGLMDGDDNGYTDFEQLCHEEDVARNFPSGSYKLLGDCLDHEKKEQRTSRSFFKARGEDLFQNSALHVKSDAHAIVSNELLSATAPIRKVTADLPCRILSAEATGNPHTRSMYTTDTPGSDQKMNTEAQQKELSMRTILEVIGKDSVVVRNVLALQNVQALRERALLDILTNSVQKLGKVKEEAEAILPNEKATHFSANGTHRETKGNTSVQAELETNTAFTSLNDIGRHEKSKYAVTLPVEEERDLIVDVPNSNPVRRRVVVKPVEQNSEWTQGRGVCALLVAHSGFTHSSENALNILTDAMAHFVQQIGKSLDTWRETEEAEPISLDEQMRIIGSSGFRGGLADLVSYAKTDLVRAEQAIHEAQAKLSRHESIASPSNFPMDPATSGIEIIPKDRQEAEEGDNVNNEKDSLIESAELRVNEQAFAFGFLNRKIRLDLLDGIKVPRKIAYGERGGEGEKLDAG